MKKIGFMTLLCVLAYHLSNAQAPPAAFNHSAIARNTAGQPIVNTLIGIQVSIIKSSSSGNIVYSENHQVNTDTFGLFNLVIGDGVIQNGNFSTINWHDDDYFIRVGMDVTGGSNFITLGTTQFLSVPYAMHSNTTDSILGGAIGNGVFIRKIGEVFGGGVVFHLWKDSQGVERGLVVDLADLSISQSWSNVTLTLIGIAAQSSWDGLANSNAIVGQSGHSNSAAAICLNSTNGGLGDWYLPSFDELSLLYHNLFNVNKTLSITPGASVMPLQASYWSSTENAADNAFYLDFRGGTSYATTKGGQARVRAIRAF